MNENEEVVGKQSLDLKVWKKLWPFVKPYWGRILGIIFMMIFSAGVDVAMPLMLSYAVDNFVTPRVTTGIVPFTVVYGTIALLQIFSTYAFCRFCWAIEMRLGRDLKRATFYHLQKLSFSYYNQNSVGYLVARVMSDTGRISGMVAWGAVDLFWGVTYIIGVFVAMLCINFRLAILVILVVPVIVFLTKFFQKRILATNRKVRSLNSKITGAYNEGITGAKTSKTLVIESKNDRDFEELTGEMYRESMHLTRLNAVFIPIITFAGSFAAAIVLARGGHQVMNGVIKYGVLSAFITYALSVLDPIQNVARTIADVIATQVNVERVSALMEHPEDIKDSVEIEAKYGDCFEPKQENWEPIHGDIEFKDVWFKYPDGDDYILENFNLKIPAGTTVAIVGETGAGKSTLVNLACRFFEPNKGQILIDGVDYRERSQLWLHSGLGYVLQNPHLFSGSVRENIRYGRLDATDDEVAEAAKLVSADTVVAKLEKGYDSDVGEGGDRLSTGEKQLISFARAVLADPPIFVLDEATSSIDTETEQLIQNAISHILKGRTSFLIAHRLSTIRRADLILVVRDGKIIEQGTHDELIASKGYYESLYKKQFSAEAEENILH